MDVGVWAALGPCYKAYAGLKRNPGLREVSTKGSGAEDSHTVQLPWFRV